MNAEQVPQVIENYIAQPSMETLKALFLFAQGEPEEFFSNEGQWIEMVLNNYWIPPKSEHPSLAELQILPPKKVQANIISSFGEMISAGFDLKDYEYFYDEYDEIYKSELNQGRCPELIRDSLQEGSKSQEEFKEAIDIQVIESDYMWRLSKKDQNGIILREKIGLRLYVETPWFGESSKPAPTGSFPEELMDELNRETCPEKIIEVFEINEKSVHFKNMKVQVVSPDKEWKIRYKREEEEGGELSDGKWIIQNVGWKLRLYEERPLLSQKPEINPNTLAHDFSNPLTVGISDDFFNLMYEWRKTHFPEVNAKEIVEWEESIKIGAKYANLFYDRLKQPKDPWEQTWVIVSAIYSIVRTSVFMSKLGIIEESVVRVFQFFLRGYLYLGNSPKGIEYNERRSVKYFLSLSKYS